MVSSARTNGALEIGVLISMFLIGVATVQTYIYFQRFPKDPKLLKLMVGVVWIMELGHTIAGLDSNPILGPAFSVGALLSGYIAALVQAYYSHRLYILSGNLRIAVLFWVMAVIRFVTWTYIGVAGGLASLLLTSGQLWEGRWKWPLVVMFTFGAVVDFVIAASLFWFFRRSRDYSTNQTTRLLNKLMVWTTKNGLVASVAGIATSICLITMPKNFIWVAVHMVLTRLFCNSFLASINRRLLLRNMDVQPGSGAQPPTDFSVLRFSHLTRAHLSDSQP